MELHEISGLLLVLLFFLLLFLVFKTEFYDAVRQCLESLDSIQKHDLAMEERKRAASDPNPQAPITP